MSEFMNGAIPLVFAGSLDDVVGILKLVTVMLVSSVLLDLFELDFLPDCSTLEPEIEELLVKSSEPDP